jgi:hypothetical protein
MNADPLLAQRLALLASRLDAISQKLADMILRAQEYW